MVSVERNLCLPFLHLRLLDAQDIRILLLCKIEKPFAHIVYVTAQEPGEELKRMMEFCSVCVLHCREGKDGKENTAGEYTVFSPDTMEESLYQLLV